MSKVASAAILALVLAVSRPARSDQDLGISPVLQHTPVWCWAAVAAMVFDHLGLPNINPGGNYQCGVVALLHPACSFNCGICITPIGTSANFSQVLRGYPWAVARERLSFLVTGALSQARIRENIDNDSPVIVGISPGLPPQLRNPQGAQHVALIVGYENEQPGLYLIVNDPMPYFMIPGMSDPYVSAGGTRIAPGQYRIRYDRFRDNVGWHISFHSFQLN